MVSLKNENEYTKNNENKKTKKTGNIVFKGDMEYDVIEKIDIIKKLRPDGGYVLIIKAEKD